MLLREATPMDFWCRVVDGLGPSVRLATGTKAARLVLDEDDENVTAGSQSSQTHPACF